MAETGTKGSSAILATELEVVGIGPVAGEDTVVGNTLAGEAMALEAFISAVTKHVTSTGGLGGNPGGDRLGEGGVAGLGGDSSAGDW